MANITISTCPPPFLDNSAYSSTGGYQKGRFCGNITSALTCCLPCPLEQWIYSDDFTHKANIAYWFNVPALVCQVFLLLTFAVLPVEKGQRHYLSIGLCVSLMLLELSFVIPLGTKPKQCYDAITPRNMHSSQSCAWTGALLEVRSMAATVWILLRSLWTHVQVCWDIKHTYTYMWLAQALGWGMPALFLAISLRVTGVSYRLGTTCLPNPHAAFVTWFGWLIAFGCLGALIQFVTSGFCLWVYARHSWVHTQSDPNSSAKSNSAASDAPATPEGRQQTQTPKLGKRLAWWRVKKVMLIQWRSIVLSMIVIIETVDFGTVYVAITRTEKYDQSPQHRAAIQAWSACLVLTGGDKKQCLHLTKALGLDETTVVASLVMSAVIGLFTFGLMLRWSMMTGWWELIRHRNFARRPSDEDFIIVNQGGPMRVSMGKPLVSEIVAKEPEKPTALLPDPDEKVRQISLPEAGDVTKRHETTKFFDDEDEEEGERRSGPAYWYS